MVNMSPLPDDVYTRADTALYQDLSRKDVLTLFVYNQHLYFDGERKFIDENSSQVRTEMRRNTVVAPLTVFSFFEGIRVNGSCVVCGDKTVDLGECDFHIAPFEHLGHLYVPVKETAETLGLCAVCAYLDRVVAIGREEKIKEISDAFRKNENLAVAAADLVIGKYDARNFTSADFQTARKKWRKSLVGTPETIDIHDEDIQKKLAAIENSARKLIHTLNRGRDIPALWGSKAPAESEDLNTAYENIRTLALAFGTYGTKYYQDESLKRDILFALKWMYENMYGKAELEERGWRSIHAFNWWHWYCGAPEALTDILLIMEEHLTKAQISDYMMLFKWLLDHWRLNYTQNECSGRMSVGTKAALILEDAERLAISANDYHIMLDIVPEGPGTHTDYSNYQHGFPYNLVYGFSNLRRVLKAGANLAGTPLEFTSHRSYNLFVLFQYMFDAAMYRGRGFKCFMGRAFGDDCRSVGYEAVSNIVPMLGSYGPEEDEYIAKFIKYSLPTDTQRSAIVDISSISAYSVISKILKDASIPTTDTRNFAHAWFSADRAAQHRNGYAFSLAMPSRRHPNYECINHRNKTGWYTGDGALFLYNEANEDEFSGENFIRNPRIAHRIPGTTVDAREREALSISMEAGWCPSSDKVGCMDFEREFIIAGMDYESYHMAETQDIPDLGYGGGNPGFLNDLSAKKAYFMLDKECVCLGAGIHSTMDSEIHTVVQHRILLRRDDPRSADDILSVDGRILDNAPFEKIFCRPSYACTENYAGFVFLDAEKVSVAKYLFAYDYEEECRKRTGSEDSIPYAEKKNRPFAETMILHGKNPVNAGYAYVILPNAGEETVKTYSEEPEIEVICNTSSLQAIRKESLGLTACVFYEAGKCMGIHVNAPALVAVREKDNQIKIKVCEPTNKADSLELIIDRRLKLLSADNRFDAVCGEKTKLILNTSNSYGEGYEALFMPD